jgi:hypothetical protein
MQYQPVHTDIVITIYLLTMNRRVQQIIKTTMTSKWDFRTHVFSETKMKTVVNGKVVKRRKREGEYILKWDMRMNPQKYTTKRLPAHDQGKVAIARLRITITELVNPCNDTTLPSEHTLRLCFAGKLNDVEYLEDESNVRYM